MTLSTRITNANIDIIDGEVYGIHAELNEQAPTTLVALGRGSPRPWGLMYWLGETQVYFYL